MLLFHKKKDKLKRCTLSLCLGCFLIFSFGLYANTEDTCRPKIPKIIHYTGCVNLGMRDTIELKVKPDADIISYEWFLPETWRILGCDTCETISVITNDFKKQAQVYGVVGKNACALPSEKAMDSLWIRGTDTTMVINAIFTRLYMAYFFSKTSMGNEELHYNLFWYKDSVSVELLRKGINISQDLINPSNPVLQYKHKDSTCWSVAKNVYIPKAKDTLHTCSGDSVLWQGNYYKKAGDYTNEARTHYDCVDTIYKDRLHLTVHPTYFDTIFAKVERDSLPYILGQNTFSSFGLHTLYRGKSVANCDSIRYLQLDTLDCNLEKPKIIPYTGCVNLGMRDTIVLKVIPTDATTYIWSLPQTWTPIGCITCDSIVVATREESKIQHIYGVQADNGCTMKSQEVWDSIWMQGADTTMIIHGVMNRLYTVIFHPNNPVLESSNYDFFWYKDSIGISVGKGLNIFPSSILPSNPVLQYKHVDSACWSVAKNVYIPKAKDTLHTCSGDSILWQGTYYKKAGDYTNEARTHYDCVDTIYKDRLHLKVYPVYRDTTFVAIERDSLPYIFGQNTISSFGLHIIHSDTTTQGCDSIEYLQLDTLNCNLEKPQIIPYTGCVNLGMRDTIELAVEPDANTNSYEWFLPETWTILGCDTCALISVITHDFKKQVQVYGVVGKNACALPSEKAMDSLWIRGTDTTMVINNIFTAVYTARFIPNVFVEHLGFYSFLWHKDSINIPISEIISIAQNRILPSNPVLQYKHKDSACWSVAKNVYIPKAKDTLHTCSGDSILWQGTYYKKAGDYTNEARTHYDCVDTIYKDRLHLTVHPTYFDTIFAKVERDSLPYIVGQNTIHNFGFHTLYSGRSVEGCDSIEYLQLDTLNCNLEKPKIIPYTGCVNLGMRDTIELKVKPDADITSYKWFLPETWTILGCDTCATISVITHDFKKQAQVYGVVGKNECANPSTKSMDSIWIRGTNTTVVINNIFIALYTVKYPPNLTISKPSDYSIFWYKDSIGISIGTAITIAQHLFSPSNPVLQYKHKDSACWSVAKNVYIPKAKDTLHTCSGDSILWQGTYYKKAGDYTNEARTHYDCVDTIYKDRLHLKVYPVYRDTTFVAIERDSLPYIFGQNTIRSFGLHIIHSDTTTQGCDSIEYLQLDTLYIHRTSHFHDSATQCQDDSLLWHHKYYAANGKYTDTIKDPYQGGTDSIYYLNLTVYPTYHDTVFASVERDSLPYLFNSQLVTTFGWHSFPSQSIKGCDSITVLNLDTLYIHRTSYFHDSATQCQGDSLLWHHKYYAASGNYTDTVKDPYQGGTDSIYYLNLTVYPTYHLSYTDSCHKDSLPYTFQGYLFTEFGTKNVTYTSKYGCDSLLSLTLNPLTYRYTVSVSVSGNGSANIEGDTSQIEKTNLVVYFTPQPCYQVDSLFVDGLPVSPQSSYIFKNLSANHRIHAVFSLKVLSSNLDFYLCPEKLPLVYNGKSYGTGSYQIFLKTAQGCDSTVYLSIVQKENVSQVDVLDSIPPLCSGIPLEITYKIVQGKDVFLKIGFSPQAQEQGFKDTTVQLPSYTAQYRKFKLPAPEDAAPGRYPFLMSYTDRSGCFVGAQNLSFEVRYPTSLIQQKWDDLLAVKAPLYNGDYTFNAFQWFQDNKPIKGATLSYFHQKPWLSSKSEYTVLLTRASDGLSLLSCPVKRQKAPAKLEVNMRPNPNDGNQPIHIDIHGNENTLYKITLLNGLGQTVHQSEAGSGVLTLTIPLSTGVYILRVESPDKSEVQALKLVVL